MKAYIYIAPLDCDFSLMPCGRSTFSSCVMVACEAFSPSPNLGLGKQGQR